MTISHTYNFGSEFSSFGVEDVEGIAAVGSDTSSSTVPIESNKIGMWSVNDGLQITDTPKWYRRGNLKVR